MAKLDRASIAKLPPPPTGKFDVVYWDEELAGLGLRVLASGTRSWVVRYRIGRRQRVITLGKVAFYTPTQARRKAGEILAKAKLGHDVRTEIHDKKSHDGNTLGELIDLYLQRYAETMLRPRTRAEASRHLRSKWQDLHAIPAKDVTRQTVAAHLTKLEGDSGLVTRNRARSALLRTFAWAMQEGLVEHNPVIDTAKRPETSRDRVLSNEELAAIWAATSLPGDHNVIVRLLLLTGQRRDEVAAMRWSEIDQARALWSMPAARTKNARPHDVPLSNRASAIIMQIPHRGGRDLVFGEADGPFSGWSRSKRRLDGRSDVAGWRLHDLRRTVVTGMAEIGIQPHIIEAVVNHVSGHKAGVAGIYNRAAYASEKRHALQRWSDHVEGLVIQS